MKKLLIPVAVLLINNVFAQKAKQVVVTDFATRYAETITAAELKQKLSIIAGPEMEGRLTTTPGQKKAAAFIEDQFKKLGLLPGTTSGFQMQYPVYQDTILDMSLKVNDKTYKADNDYSINIAAAPNGTINIKEVVFATFGITDSVRDNYKDLDVKGKWVLFFAADPGNEKEVNRFHVTAKVLQAKALGAKGVFIMRPDFPKTTPSPLMGSMYINRVPKTPALPSISVSEELAHYILGLNPKELIQNIRQIQAGDYKTNVTFSLNKKMVMLQSSNVIGLLPGTDKKDEYVLVTGHYDHLGVKGKDIYYGADDDGSGTTSVMQIAAAFAKAKNEGHGPRRSVVFMAVSGEEEGLLGSEFYSDFPAFPLDKTSADLNIDMVGRIDPEYKGDSLNYVYIIGDDKLSSTLRPLTDSANKSYLNMELDRKFNNLNDPNRFYYRSDHYNFAKNGVPVIFYFNGTHADYHKPTDTIDKINFDLMAKRAKLVFYTSWNIANRDAMLVRDIPLPKQANAPR